MSISVYLTPITNNQELIVQLLQDEFYINPKHAEALYDRFVKQHFDQLKDSLYILAETGYVDKVYRDSYYHYYSSKLNSHKRNCIRLSFFNDVIEDYDFKELDGQRKLRETYLGFMVLRPTEPHLIGRSILSPKALKRSNFFCCTSSFSTTANGLKLIVNGFPHSSQDTETISCAETTLWAIMEYFSNKYSEYNPALPSKIIRTLNKVSAERQTPSKGLNIAQMSFALKEFGFGTRIYSREEYQNDFDSLLSCYVSSGIPLLAAMENRPVGSIGHALLAIGHEHITADHIDRIPAMIPTGDLGRKMTEQQITLYDYDDAQKQFVFIDDNKPAYQTATLKQPASHYSSSWSNCRLTYFIVPLYTKIYLEAFEAKNYIIRFLVSSPAKLKSESKALLRFYLSSSRSFKNSIAGNNSIQEDVRSLILETSMPKFIWVAELSSKELIKRKTANGLILLDATEANIQFHKPLIMAVFQDRIVSREPQTGRLKNDFLALQEFTIFEHNLNMFTI